MIGYSPFSALPVLSRQGFHLIQHHDALNILTVLRVWHVVVVLFQYRIQPFPLALKAGQRENNTIYKNKTTCAFSFGTRHLFFFCVSHGNQHGIYAGNHRSAFSVKRWRKIPRRTILRGCHAQRCSHWTYAIDHQSR